MPVEFLSDEEAARFGRYEGPPSRGELERAFFLDDADRARWWGADVATTTASALRCS